MESYAKPMIRALPDDVAVCGCNFHFNETPRDCTVPILPGTVEINGPCATVDPGQPQTGGELNLGAIRENTILGVSDGALTVTPLANTGLPLTQPISFGVPVGTRGIYLDVSANGVKFANGEAVGVAVGGQAVVIPLP